MIRVGSRIGGAFLLVAALTACASAALGEPFHTERWGYQIEVPRGWKRIADADLQAMVAAAQNPGARTPLIFDAAFEPVGHRQPFEYPYVIVQVLPYSAVGLNRQINEDEFGNAIKGITGVNLDDRMKKQLSTQAQSLVSNPTIGQVVLERTNRRFWYTNEVSVAGIGRVRGMITGHFGRGSIVQVCYYAPAAQWDRHLDPAHEVGDSLKFDPAQAYSVEAAKAHPSSGLNWGYVASKSVFGAIVGGAVGVSRYLGSLRRKSAAVAPPGPPPLPGGRPPLG
jgi:hypothetical protein